MTTKQDVLDFFSADDEAQAERHIYKYTDCGAWISFKPWGVLIGSIVEGSDFGTATYPLRYENNFTHKDIQDRIDAVEKEAEALWRWCNIADADDKSAADYGVDAPDVSTDYSHFEQGERSS